MLFIAFGVISFLVFLTKRHPYFVSKKLRIGALILSLSGVTAGCAQIVSCYLPAPSNIFYVDQSDTSNNEITINRTTTDTITGKIENRSGTAFSYMIIDSVNATVLKNDLTPADGVFDEAIEEFKIGLGHSLTPGNYNLRFYTSPKDSIISPDRYCNSFTLKIIG
jgi:hypothetical protein